jgi:hypothetical protein
MKCIKCGASNLLTAHVWKQDMCICNICFDKWVISTAGKLYRAVPPSDGQMEIRNKLDQMWIGGEVD